MTELLSHSPGETVQFGGTFGGALAPGDVVALYGDLGTGKTQFVMGVCQALGVQAHVGSPTFTLINEYPAPFGTVVHIDLYRIRSREELAELGIDEYFSRSTICLIEWAESVREFLPVPHYEVDLRHGSTETERIITTRRVEEQA